VGGTQGGNGEQPKAKATSKISLDDFLVECRTAGEPAIPESDAVFAYADSIGLPHDFVALAWSQWFKPSYAAKKQVGVRGWRQTFRNCVEGNWPKYWYTANGEWLLTTAGKQAQMARDAQLAELEAAA
jgi:hypothetical protein